MTAFQTDDWYNVVPEHVIEALKLDAKLGTGGTLAIKTWEQEFREGADEFNENELPAIAVSCDLAGTTATATAQLSRAFIVTIWVVTDSGRKKNVEQSIKAYAARVERTMQQQHDTSKQLVDVTTDLLESIADSVQVEPVSAAISDDAVQKSNVRRGVAVLTFAVSIDFTITID